MDTASGWQRRLSKLADEHGVPGATLGILRTPDRRVTVAHGVLNTATGVAATPDSLFQLGSVTKAWTATALVRLADTGQVELDAPVVEILPKLTLGDPEATRSVRIRHLLTHTSGIDGDAFIDTGPGDDCLERYAERLAGVRQLYPPGAFWSYSNSSYVLAGRVIEAVTGQVWDTAMRELLFAPLDLSHTVTQAGEAVLHRVAAGHQAGGVPVPVWRPGRFCGPGGGIACSIGDLLTFARLHLTDGLAGNGTRLLSESAVRGMRERRVDLPAGRPGGWASGWQVGSWDGVAVAGHSGEISGQAAVLWLLPERGLAVAVQCNSTGAAAESFTTALLTEVFAELAKVRMPPPPVPPDRPGEFTAPIGAYQGFTERLEVASEADQLVLRWAGQDWQLVPAGGDVFLTRLEGDAEWSAVSVAEFGGTRYLHVGGRAYPEVAV